MNAPLLDTAALTALLEYARRQGHPRLWVDGAQRERILANASSGLCREMAERLRWKCEQYCTPGGEHFLDLDTYDSNALLARPGQYVLSRIMAELAFAGWLWEDERFLRSAKEIVLRRAREAFLTAAGGSPDYSYHRSPLGVGQTGSALAWTADLLHPFLTGAEWADVVGHVRDYYLTYADLPFFRRERLHGVGFNKTLHGMCATGELALLIAEELPAEEFNHHLSEALRSAWGYSREAMDDDGGTYEGPGYGAGCVGHVIRFAEALRRHGYDLLAGYRPLHNHAKWLASIMAPGGGTLALGDSFGADNISPVILLPANWTRDAGLQWAYLAGLGRPDHPNGPYGDHFDLWGSVLPQQLAWYDPALPAENPAALGWPPAYYAQGSDYVTLRSGWEERDVLATLSGCGRRATAAAHLGAEPGALALTAFGQDLLFDPGYGFTTADAHSTVQVSNHDPAFHDGGNARCGARVIRFANGRFAALATVEMSQMLDCRWAFRDVALLRGRLPYLVVADDVNFNSDWSEYDWFWQAHPNAELQLPDPGPFARIAHAGAVLDLCSLAPAPDAYPKTHELTWQQETFHPRSWSNKSREQQRLRLHVAGYNGKLLTLLFPHPADVPPPAVTRIDCPVPGIAARVCWDGIEDTILFQPYSRFLQTDRMIGCGRLAVVREEDHQVTGTVLIDGYELTWNGRPLVPPRQRAGHVILPE